ncbi:MAG: vanadium-dependent haloperoxidase [Cyclobacteriaceae bacterium]
MKNITFLPLLILLFLFACQKEPVDYSEAAHNPEFMHASVKKLTDVIVYDIFSPPVASRIYAYPSIAAYEALINEYPEYQSLSGQLKGLSPTPKPEPNQEYCYPLASLQAYITEGKKLIFSEEKIDAYAQQLYGKFKAMGVPKDVMDRSIAYGDQVAKHIGDWADQDNYHQTRTFPKFTINDDSYRWQPTPPDYMDAIEPHWNKIRTFVLDSAHQFVPKPPTPFDMEENSTFYKEVLEVYETGKKLTEEQESIAQFWDCNPYVSHHQGHVMFATKKITPGGHWIGITAIASRKAHADLMKTTQAYAFVTIALADAFISCWDEKYRSELIRPETVINKYIDEDWVPVLQTPPFPEYTSGHSVISASAATALTELYGEPFEFQDTTEVEYGLPPRNFSSFFEASEEAAISRMYGGIHYMPACINGIDQGKKVGRFVVDNLSFKKSVVSDSR